jgi:hypothetical protein
VSASCRGAARRSARPALAATFAPRIRRGRCGQPSGATDTALASPAKRHSGGAAGGGSPKIGAANAYNDLATGCPPPPHPRHAVSQSCRGAARPSPRVRVRVRSRSLLTAALARGFYSTRDVRRAPLAGVCLSGQSARFSSTTNVQMISRFMSA